MTLIFLPKFLSSMRNMEGGTSCSGIYLTSQNLYKCCFKDKTVAPLKYCYLHGAYVGANQLLLFFSLFYVKIIIDFIQNIEVHVLMVLKNASLT